MINIYSLKAMESAARNDIKLMFLTDEIKPSHQAIGDLINNHLIKNNNDIFKEINNYIIKEENINPNVLFIEGTKIESKANKYTFVWKKTVEKNEGKLHLKISRLLEKLNKQYHL